MKAEEIKKALKKFSNPARAKLSQGYFKTGPGEYGEGDVFMGASVPQIREVTRAFRGLPLAECLKLLKSPIHEERLTGVLLMVDAFGRGDQAQKAAVYKAYLANLKRINNWDLVDSSAGYIVGAWLEDKDRGVLDKLADSKLLWARRVAVIATFHFIGKGQAKDSLRLAAKLLNDKEDLMHKAVGWMLRELGKRVSIEDLRGFLKKYAKTMPRTMLRYAIEKMDAKERSVWMKK